MNKNPKYRLRKCRGKLVSVLFAFMICSTIMVASSFADEVEGSDVVASTSVNIEDINKIDENKPVNKQEVTVVANNKTLPEKSDTKQHTDEVNIEITKPIDTRYEFDPTLKIGTENKEDGENGKIKINGNVSYDKNKNIIKDETTIEELNGNSNIIKYNENIVKEEDIIENGKTGITPVYNNVNRTANLMDLGLANNDLIPDFEKIEKDGTLKDGWTYDLGDGLFDPSMTIQKAREIKIVKKENAKNPINIPDLKFKTNPNSDDYYKTYYTDGNIIPEFENNPHFRRVGSEGNYGYKYTYGYVGIDFSVSDDFYNPHTKLFNFNDYISNSENSSIPNVFNIVKAFIAGGSKTASDEELTNKPNVYKAADALLEEIKENPEKRENILKYYNSILELKNPDSNNSEKNSLIKIESRIREKVGIKSKYTLEDYKNMLKEFFNIVKGELGEEYKSPIKTSDISYSSIIEIFNPYGNENNGPLIGVNYKTEEGLELINNVVNYYNNSIENTVDENVTYDFNRISTLRFGNDNNFKFITLYDASYIYSLHKKGLSTGDIANKMSRNSMLDRNKAEMEDYINSRYNKSLYGFNFEKIIKNNEVSFSDIEAFVLGSINAYDKATIGLNDSFNKNDLFLNHILGNIKHSVIVPNSNNEYNRYLLVLNNLLERNPDKANRIPMDQKLSFSIFNNRPDVDLNKLIINMDNLINEIKIMPKTEKRSISYIKPFKHDTIYIFNPNLKSENLIKVKNGRDGYVKFYRETTKNENIKVSIGKGVAEVVPSLYKARVNLNSPITSENSISTNFDEILKSDFVLDESKIYLITPDSKQNISLDLYKKMIGHTFVLDLKSIAELKKIDSEIGKNGSMPLIRFSEFVESEPDIYEYGVNYNLKWKEGSVEVVHKTVDGEIIIEPRYVVEEGTLPYVEYKTEDKGILEFNGKKYKFKKIAKESDKPSGITTEGKKTVIYLYEPINENPHDVPPTPSIEIPVVPITPDNDKPKDPEPPVPPVVKEDKPIDVDVDKNDNKNNDGEDKNKQDSGEDKNKPLENKKLKRVKHRDSQEKLPQMGSSQSGIFNALGLGFIGVAGLLKKKNDNE